MQVTKGLADGVLPRQSLPSMQRLTAPVDDATGAPAAGVLLAGVCNVDWLAQFCRCFGRIDREIIEGVKKLIGGFLRFSVTETL